MGWNRPRCGKEGTVEWDIVLCWPTGGLSSDLEHVRFLYTVYVC